MDNFCLRGQLTMSGDNSVVTVDFPGGSDGKESAWNAGDPGSITESERSGEGNGNSLQHSDLENPMDRGAWQRATIHRVTKSHTQLRD